MVQKIVMFKLLYIILFVSWIGHPLGEGFFSVIGAIIIPNFA